ncbi:MAG: hypothetical protein ACOC5T_05475 [Elusimicrobiota bacterium]
MLYIRVYKFEELPPQLQKEISISEGATIIQAEFTKFLEKKSSMPESEFYQKLGCDRTFAQRSRPWRIINKFYRQNKEEIDEIIASFLSEFVFTKNGDKIGRIEDAVDM